MWYCKCVRGCPNVYIIYIALLISPTSVHVNGRKEGMRV